MIIKYLISGQLYNYPDNNERINNFVSLSTSQSVTKAIYKVKLQYSKRFFDRTLQTLWESWLPLCARAWTRPQIFSICKFSKDQASDDLRTFILQEAYRRGIRQLSKSQTNFRRNQQNQPRVIKAQGIVTGERWVYQLIYQRQQWWLPIW